MRQQDIRCSFVIGDVASTFAFGGPSRQLHVTGLTSCLVAEDDTNIFTEQKTLRVRIAYIPVNE
jgi:hypothetical protein